MRTITLPGLSDAAIDDVCAMVMVEHGDETLVELMAELERFSASNGGRWIISIEGSQVMDVQLKPGDGF